MKITRDAAVRIHYHLTSPNRDVIDSSRGGEPLAYLHGRGMLVAGVETALEGQEAGAQLQVVVSPEDGYGVRDPQLDVSVPLSAFPEPMQSQVAPGGMFHGRHPVDAEKVVQFTVVQVDGDRVFASANHQLAGMTLHFELDVVEVRAATTEEIADGHIHGPGGHHH